LILDLVRNIGFNFIEDYIWFKTATMPFKSNYRAYDRFEYCFWLQKDKSPQFYYDKVRCDYTDTALQRFQYKYMNLGKSDRYISPNKAGALPFNVLELSPAVQHTLGHTAPYPVSLPEWFLKATDSNIILDPFGGSGSTMIACEKLNRRCYMMEIDEHYCDVIVERWTKFTGEDAVREDGVKWSELSQKYGMPNEKS
jgi:DNA modification methylase